MATFVEGFCGYLPTLRALLGGSSRIDSKVEHCEVTHAPFHLQLCQNGPDVAQSEWRFRPYQFPLFQGERRGGFAELVVSLQFMTNLLSKGLTKTWPASLSRQQSGAYLVGGDRQRPCLG